MNFSNDFNVINSSCSAVDGGYSDDTESMVNHARSSPMNASISNTSMDTIATAATTTTPMMRTNDDDDDDDDEKDDNESLNDTNSHTTVDDDLMNSYAASLGIDDDDDNDNDIISLKDNHNHHYTSKCQRISNDFGSKKLDKQVTFQDVVEISTIYSIVNESQESISHNYEDDIDDEEEGEGLMSKNEHNVKKMYEQITCKENKVRGREKNPDSGQMVSDKDLLTVSNVDMLIEFK
ncbi:unnamed protein product [Heterobilharzia americana]|nr:unnamed protein product [Heterobilharzia americana]